VVDLDLQIDRDFDEALTAVAWREPAPPRGEILARWTAGRAACPGVDVPAAPFLRHLAQLVDPDLPPVAHAGDVYLSHACAVGDAEAHARFTALHGAYLDRVVSSIDSSPSFRDEATQVLREKLFLPSGEGPAKIAEYGGRAPLRSWLRVVAKRTALNLIRDDRRRELPRRAVEEDVATSMAPELAYMKALYREQFEEALRGAFRALTARQRTVLRLHLAQRMTLAQLGAVYDVSHATAARWLAAAHDTLVTTVRRTLKERLALTPSEIDSVAALVRSQIDVRIGDLLASIVVPRETV